MKKDMNLKRRQFLKTLGVSVVTLQVIPVLLKKASAQMNSPEFNCGAELNILSGPSAYAPLPGHFHYLNIETAIFKNPPTQGVKIMTSIAYLHQHQVILSQEQLLKVAQGDTITVEDSVKDHHYEIKLC